MVQQRVDGVCLSLVYDWWMMVGVVVVVVMNQMTAGDDGAGLCKEKEIDL